MASNFVLYYSIWALFATHLQADLKLTTMGTAVPFMIANILSFLGMSWWGWTADKIGRRWAMIIPATHRSPDRPIYLFTSDPFWITIGFGLQGAFGGALYSQLPSYLSERFADRGARHRERFCYHQGAILGGLVAPVLAYFAVNYDLGYAIPMLVGTVTAAVSVVISCCSAPRQRARFLRPNSPSPEIEPWPLRRGLSGLLPRWALYHLNRGLRATARSSRYTAVKRQAVH